VGWGNFWLGLTDGGSRCRVDNLSYADRAPPILASALLEAVETNGEVTIIPVIACRAHRHSGYFHLFLHRYLVARTVSCPVRLSLFFPLSLLLEFAVADLVHISKCKIVDEPYRYD
jgi:hypothetical protein